MTRSLRALALASTALIASHGSAETGRRDLPQVFTMTPGGVNLQSGIFITSQTDITMGTLSFVRGWRSFATHIPASGGTLYPMGGWDHNFALGAAWHQSAPNGINIYVDGQVYQFRFVSSWTPANLDQFNNNAAGTTLTGSYGVNLVFRNKDGDSYAMNADNLVTRIDRADGTRIDLTYSSQKRVRTIVSSRGDAIVLDYNGTGLVTAACGYNRAVTQVTSTTTCSGAPIGVSYGYSATAAAQGWVLSSVTGADGQVTSMSYDGYHRPNLTCVTLPGSGTCRFTNIYNALPGEDPAYIRPDQVRRQVMATGERWDYSYENLPMDELPPQPGQIYPSASEVLLNVNPDGSSGGFFRGEYENGQLKRLLSPDGPRQYGWNGLFPNRFVSPGGNDERLGYDARGNVISHRRIAAPGSPDADLTRLIVPGTCDGTNFRTCNKPDYVTDERGSQTDYTYDPAHGGVLTETLPAPTSGAVRPQTRYTYAQIAGGVLSGGSIVAETPVWVLTQESRCQTLATCTGTTDEVRTLYEYGPSGTANALRLRGVTVTGGGVTSRTCYGYDPTGNRISETGPGAALGTCP
jgi:YD repeat-containing protein